MSKQFSLKIKDFQNKKTLQNLENAGLSLRKNKQSKSISNKLLGKKIVISGVFENYTRDELISVIEIVTEPKKSEYLVVAF